MSEVTFRERLQKELYAKTVGGPDAEWLLARIRGRDDAIDVAVRLHEEETAARVVVEAGLRIRVEELEADNTALRQPFDRWVQQQEDWAVAQSLAGRHVFVQTPDGEGSDVCLRCLNSSPNAGQGCVEHTRKRRMAAESEVARLREALERIRDGISINASTAADAYHIAREAFAPQGGEVAQEHCGARVNNHSNHGWCDSECWSTCANGVPCPDHSKPEEGEVRPLERLRRQLIDQINEGRYCNARDHDCGACNCDEAVIALKTVWDLGEPELCQEDPKNGSQGGEAVPHGSRGDFSGRCRCGADWTAAHQDTFCISANRVADHPKPEEGKPLFCRGKACDRLGWCRRKHTTGTAVVNPFYPDRCGCGGGAGEPHAHDCGDAQ